MNQGVEERRKERARSLVEDLKSSEDFVIKKKKKSCRKKDKSPHLPELEHMLPSVWMFVLACHTKPPPPLPLPQSTYSLNHPRR